MPPLFYYLFRFSKPNEAKTLQKCRFEAKKSQNIKHLFDRHNYYHTLKKAHK